jgi:hypothetical protein
MKIMKEKEQKVLNLSDHSGRQQGMLSAQREFYKLSLNSMLFILWLKEYVLQCALLKSDQLVEMQGIKLLCVKVSTKNQHVICPPPFRQYAQ